MRMYNIGGGVMDNEVFFKKVYTVSFRLTGQEQVAEEIASQAIIHIFKEMNEDYKEKVTENMLRLTILELMRLFLSNPSTDCNDNVSGVQSALLELKPVNRAVVIWKDVLGYKIHDNIPVSDYTYEELYKELVRGRKELKKYKILSF